MKDISYGIIPVFKKDKDCLFCLVLHKAGHWAFPKGHLIGNEKPLDTAKRELYEEAGITRCSIRENVLFEEKYSYEDNGQNIEKIVTYFLGFIYEPEINIPEKFKLEILDAKLLIYDEAMKLLTYETAKDLLKKVKDYLLRNS
jgi:8-oxo-dGTP pyrophosphatase MutT (NUDIX family)